MTHHGATLTTAGDTQRILTTVTALALVPGIMGALAPPAQSTIVVFVIVRVWCFIFAFLFLNISPILTSFLRRHGLRRMLSAVKEGEDGAELEGLE